VAGAGDELLDDLMTADGMPARLGERAYAPGRKWHSQLTLNRAVAIVTRGLWATPCAQEPGNKVEEYDGRGRRDHKGKADFGMGITQQAESWPTPIHSDGSPKAWYSKNAVERREERGKEISLAMRASKDDWQTPQTDSFRSRGGDRKDEMGLDQQARRGAWPTPRVDDVKNPDQPRSRRGVVPPPHLSAATKQWPTPRASEQYQGEETERGHATGVWDCTPRGATVETAARAWQTPSASETEKVRHPERDGGGQPSLAMQTKGWETPRASEADRGPCPSEMARRSPGIKAQAENFPTPTGRSAVGRAPGQTQLDIFAREMMEAPRRDFPTPTGQDAGSSGCAHLSTDSGRHAGATLTDVAIGRGVKEGPWEEEPPWILVRCECGQEFETDSLDVPCPHCGEIRGGSATYFETEQEMREAWTTPTSRDAKGMSSESRRADPTRSTANLADQALGRWNTPEAHNAKGCRGEGCQVQGDLGRQATSSFPSGLQDPETPTPGSGSSSGGQTSPRRWPSPQASDTVNKDQSRDTALSNDSKMPEFARQRTGTAKRLNPRFVEWLMGVPRSWSTATTGSGCSETEWFLWWRDALYCICSLEP